MCVTTCLHLCYLVKVAFFPPDKVVDSFEAFLLLLWQVEGAQCVSLLIIFINWLYIIITGGCRDVGRYRCSGCPWVGVHRVAWIGQPLQFRYAH